MVKWVQSVPCRAALLLVLVTVFVSACSNMFSQANSDAGSIVFEFEANLLFNEHGAAAAGTAYLIPTADRLEARLSRLDGAEAAPPIDVPLERVPGNPHAIATVIEFPSVPTNIAYRIDLRIYSSSDPVRTLHSGSTDIEPITRVTRDEQVVVRMAQGIIEPSQIELLDPKTVSPAPGAFSLYRLDTDLRPAEPHVLLVQGDPDLQDIRLQILGAGFRGTSVTFEAVGSDSEASLPASSEPYFVAVYREADSPPGAVDVTFSLSSFTPPAVSGVVSPTNNATPSFTVTGPAGAIFKYTVTGATDIPEVDVPDVGGTGEETITLAVLDEGLHTVTVYYEDVFGNISSETTFEILTDYTPPPPPTGVDSVDLQGLPPNQFTLNPTPTFSWNGSGETGATWEYSIDLGTTWIAVATPNVTLGPLTTGITYALIVREIDAAGNMSGPTPLISFQYTEGASSTITITNPTVPSFSIDTPGLILDRSAAYDWELTAIPDAGVTIDAHEWLLNGTSKGTGVSLTLNESDPDKVLGANNLTLFVLINGMWYSDSFVFQVVEN